MVGIHRKGGIYRQESSYAQFWIVGVMLVSAVIVWLLAPGGGSEGTNLLRPMCHVFSGVFVICAVAGIVPFFIRNATGQTILIDPRGRTVRIHGTADEILVSWDDVVALQICYSPDPESHSDVNTSGFQLNLVWKDSDSTQRRHCLSMQQTRHFITRLAKRYVDICGFRLIEELRGNR
jgi:hypothetical protein